MSINLVERIAAWPLTAAIANHFGFYRPSPVELVIFRSEADARQAGFRTGVLPAFPQIRAWWPGLGARGLACRPIQRVTIPSDMVQHRVDGEGRLGDILRKRQMVWGEYALWIELR